MPVLEVQKQKRVSPFSSKLFSRLIAFTAAFLVFALLFGSMFQMFESISMQAMLRMNEEFSAQASTISDSMQSIINTLGIQMFYISSTAKLRKSTSLTQNERVFALRELWQYAMSGSMLHSIYVFNPKLDYVYTTDNDYMSASMDGFYDQDAVALYRRGDAYTYIRPQLLFAALGVLASFLIALLTHSINAQVIKKTLIESIKLTSMVYAVSAFGNLFVTVFMRLGCSNAVTNLFVHLPLGKWGLFALMMAVVFLLGFLMDWIAVCMITIPIFVPIATAAGFDACYFLTMMAIIMQTAFLSPPMAASIFYFQGVAKDRITTAETIRGIWPFMALQVLVFVLCILFPQIVTWLPGHMIG